MRTVPNLVEHILSRCVERGECILWTGAKNSKGYGQVTHRYRVRSIHIVICEHYFGPKPQPDSQVLHSCNTKLCINRDHIRWGTDWENRRDAWRDGLLSFPNNLGDRGAKGRLRRAGLSRSIIEQDEEPKRE